MVGSAILKAVDRRVPLRGVAVDVGAGSGFLTDQLLRRGLEVIALDASPESVASLAKRFSASPGFRAARQTGTGQLPLADAEVDFAFLIETIEHLDDAVSRAVLAELYRISRPGAMVVITTPNDEDISSAEVMCPECGCQFHPMQHMRSFTRESLSREASTAGFETIACEATLFSERSYFVRALQNLRFILARHSWPHLLYVGRKPKNAAPAVR